MTNATKLGDRPFAYFQRHPRSGTWQEVVPCAADESGVVAAYRHPPAEKITKADTVALWYAVNWMEHVLGSWSREIEDDEDRLKYKAERDRLLTAKRALRKVNRIRKAQA